MELLKRIAKWGGIPMSVVITGTGIYLDATEAMAWGIPNWVWLVVGYCLLVIMATFIIVGLWRESKRLKLTLEQQIQNNADEAKRADRKKHRIVYADRIYIPDKLYQLFKLSQNIAEKEKTRALVDEEKSRIISTNLFQGGFFGEDTQVFSDLATSETLQEMKKHADSVDTKSTYQAIYRTLIFIKRAMAEQSVGITQYLEKDDEYINLHDEIDKLTAGLLSKTASKISDFIEIADGINNLSFIDFEKAELSPAVSIMMQALDQASDSLLKPLLSDIEKEIETFLLGEEFPK